MIGFDDLRSSNLNVFMILWFLPTLNRKKAIWELIPDVRVEASRETFCF